MENNKKILREKFISKFCKQRGWSKEKLTPEQMLLIVTNPKYKNPTIN
jgi:hypothetical protein